MSRSTSDSVAYQEVMLHYFNRPRPTDGSMFHAIDKLVVYASERDRPTCPRKIVWSLALHGTSVSGPSEVNMGQLRILLVDCQASTIQCQQKFSMVTLS